MSRQAAALALICFELAHTARADEEPPVPAVVPASLILELKGDRSVYTAGDLALFTAKTDTDCFLTLISIDRNNLATVIFPNDFEPDNRLKAGTEIKIPSANAPYQLRMKEPGIESLIGICNTTNARPRGIEHDYDRARFTILGKWSEFTDRIETREAEIKRSQQQRARRRKTAPAATSPAAAPPGPEVEGRSLLLVPVEAAVSPPTAQGP